MSPGRRGLRSCEVVEEARNLGRAGDLLGETPLFSYFKAPKARARVRPKPKGHGRRRAVERRFEGSRERPHISPTRLSWCSPFRGGFTWPSGSQGPLGRVPESPDEGTCSSPRARAGQRIRGVNGESSREEETQESIGRRYRGNPGRRERIRRRGNASKSVKRTERNGFRRSGSWATGK
jgi:hypothetical protein